MFRPSSPPQAAATLLSTLSCVENINTGSIIAVVGRFEISVTARKNNVPAVWYRHRTINKTRMWPALKILLSSTELSPTITNYHWTFTKLSITFTNNYQLSPNYQQLSPNQSKIMTCIEDTLLLQHNPHISLQRLVWLLLWKVWRHDLQNTSAWNLSEKCDFERALDWDLSPACFRKFFFALKKRCKMIIGQNYIFKRDWKSNYTKIFESLGDENFFPDFSEL